MNSKPLDEINSQIDTQLAGVIRTSTVTVQPGLYAYLQVQTLAESGAHFLVARDRDEVTVVTEERNVARTEHQGEVKWFKLIEIRVSQPFVAKGFIAAITTALAGCGLNVLVVSTYSKDYFLVREEAITSAISALKDLGFPVSSAQETV